MRDCDAALLHRNRSQAGKSDHVADRVDVRLAGPVILVHRDAAARIGFETGRRKIQLIHVALPADGIKQRVAGHFLLAFQVCDHACAVRQSLPRFALLRSGAW